MSKYDKSAASYKELVEYWNNLYEGKYYIESDYSEDKNNNYIGLCKINERRTKNKFMLDYVPEPFFGNIKNPKIILLALNPSYDSNGDKLDLEVFKKANIDISFSDFLQKIDFCKVNNQDNSILPATTNWWQNKVLKGLNIEKLAGNIGYFNLIGYHSPYNPFNNDEIICKSQFLVKEHVLNLIEKEKGIKVIIIWGKKNWNIGDMSNVYQINEINIRNKSIKNAISKEKKKRITNADDLLCLLKDND